MRVASNVMGTRRILEIEQSFRASSASCWNFSSLMPGKSAYTIRWMPSTE